MNTEFFSWKNIFVLFIIAAFFAVAVFFIFASESIFSIKKTARPVAENQNTYLAPPAEDDSLFSSKLDSPPVSIAPPPVSSFESAPSAPAEKLENPPEIIKAVYVTAWSGGSKTYLNYLSNLFRITEINAVVVDIKDYSGLVSYRSGAPEAKKYNLYNYAISDIDSLVRFFHNQNIYVIGRISVFEDPAYARAKPELAVYDKTKPALPLNNSMELSYELWQDYKGLSWVDPASKEAWDYNVSLAKDALYHGFDEINFDYIRFPSDGNMKNMGFPVFDEKTPMTAVIRDFFRYLRTELPNEKISADLFGLTTVKTDDLGIGQLIEDAFEFFDYVCPMVYPSHYANGFIGYQNPAVYPYEVIKYSLDNAVSRRSALSAFLLASGKTGVKLGKIRPWLQDFNMGAEYTAEMVKLEIKATKDSLENEFNGFMLWNPANVYNQGAVLKFAE